MSWYRQIKCLYTISLNMFFYIFWSAASYVFLGNNTDYKLYIISLASAFMFQFLPSRLKKRQTALALSCVFGVTMAFLATKGHGFIYNGLFIIFTVMAARASEAEDINYDAYKGRGRQALLVILAMGAFLPFINIYLSGRILKFYIMFLISLILVMREARSYTYKMKDKKSFITNIMLCVFILILSFDKVFNLLSSLIKAAFHFINLGLTRFIDLIGIIIAKPMNFIMEYLKPVMNKASKNLNIKITDDVIKNNKVKPPNPIIFPDWVKTSLKILIAAVIFFIVYKMILKYKYNGDGNSKDIEEEREKIRKSTKVKKNLFEKFFKDVFVKRELKNQILYVYRKFEEKTYAKGIFKKHMTASQLKNVSKAYLESHENINSITNIYNEAKFSSHDSEEEKVKTMKESYKKIKW